MMAVTARPSKTIQLFRRQTLQQDLQLVARTFFKTCSIRLIPKRNRDKPPISSKNQTDPYLTHSLFIKIKKLYHILIKRFVKCMLNVAPNKKKALYSFTTNIMPFKNSTVNYFYIRYKLTTYCCSRQNIIKIDSSCGGCLTFYGT